MYGMRDCLISRSYDLAVKSVVVCVFSHPLGLAYLASALRDDEVKITSNRPIHQVPNTTSLNPYLQIILHDQTRVYMHATKPTLQVKTKKCFVAYNNGIVTCPFI